jgi:hypothetical protein
MRKRISLGPASGSWDQAAASRPGTRRFISYAGRNVSATTVENNHTIAPTLR